jgi:uncharacterized protein YcnI
MPILQRHGSHAAARHAPITFIIALLLVPAALAGHAVVFPRTAAPGAYEKYVLRVPNERDVATTRVRLAFPAGVTVISFADVDGWNLDVETDSAGRIIAASWTGSLPPSRFVEFPFIAVNPREPATLVWPATQVYAGGETVEWSGPPDSATPASSTEIRAATAEPPSVGAGAADPAGHTVDGDSEGAGSSTGVWLGGLALLVSLAALGLALRRPAAAA